MTFRSRIQTQGENAGAAVHRLEGDAARRRPFVVDSIVAAAASANLGRHLVQKRTGQPSCHFARALLGVVAFAETDILDFYDSQQQVMRRGEVAREGSTREILRFRRRHRWVAVSWRLRGICYPDVCVFGCVRHERQVLRFGVSRFPAFGKIFQKVMRCRAAFLDFL
jgi:hypothetical protein